MTAPIPMRWDGEAMHRLPGFARQADEAFVIGEVYAMAPVEARSRASHDHYFARLHELWLSLPEHLTAQFATAEHLRKRALIKTGYYDSRSQACPSRAAALQVAAFIRPIDEFSVVIANEGVVTLYTAKSQKQRAMGKAAFQESKDAVLAYVEDMLGVEPERAAA